MDVKTESLGGDLFATLPEGIKEIVDSYLATKNHSPGLLRNVRSHLHRFFSLIQKHPFEVKLADWLMFAAHLNAQQISYASKKVMTSSVRGFFAYIDLLATQEGLQFKNPVPKLEYSGLKMDAPDAIRAKRNRAKKFLPDDKLEAILAAARGRGYAFYLMLLLLTHCGMRGNEMLTIKRGDIHLDQRWLETGLEAGARKSNKNGNRRIVFYFPESVRLAIKQYLVFAPTSEWLFPGQNGTHASFPAFAERLGRLAEKVGMEPVSSHWFRKTLNTNRKYKMKCPKEDRQKLLNHIVGDAIEAYDESDILALRDIYDTYHPYKAF